MPVITLLTDFGTTDSYVGEVKGTLARLAPAASLVDISHDIPPGDVRAGAFVLSRVWARFPSGTVHLVVVDPGVGTSRAALAGQCEGHWFVGPDNGVLTPFLRQEVAVVELPTPVGASPTFHARDLFAPAAAALAQGAALDSLGPRLPRAPTLLPIPAPHHEAKSLVGEVLYVDRFGNLISNIPGERVPEAGTIEVEGMDLGTLHRTFGDVPSGALLAYVGSGGTVEIAVRDGSAARRLGMGVGGRIRIRLG
jgi:S-adenosylmethionine hydrolase